MLTADNNLRKSSSNNNIFLSVHSEDSHHSNSNRSSQRSPVPSIPHTRVDSASSIHERYSVKTDKILGKGTFGTVCLAKDNEENGNRAIKKVSKEKAGTMGLKLLQREVDILKKVQHANIIVLHSIYETPNSMYLVFDYCDKGDLKKLLREKKTFSEEETREVFTSIVEAVHYLHKWAIVHRDIKLENILCIKIEESDQKKLNFDIRLIDFGLSVVKDGNDSMIDTWVGTPLYMAPEVVRKTGYSHLCDVWSLGIILFQLLSGFFPFYSDHEDTLYQLIQEAKLKFKRPIWEQVSDAAKHLITKMLHPHPMHRYSAGEVLNHPFMTGSDWADPREQPGNVLEMMAAWKDSLYIDEDALDDDVTETSEASKPITIDTLIAGSNRSRKNSNSSDSKNDEKHSPTPSLPNSQTSSSSSLTNQNLLDPKSKKSLTKAVSTDCTPSKNFLDVPGRSDDKKNCKLRAFSPNRTFKPSTPVNGARPPRSPLSNNRKK